MTAKIFQKESRFDSLLITYRQSADKMMLWVVHGLQLVCFALAPLNETWESASFIGLPTLALATYLVRYHCGELLTRLYIAMAFMTYTGLVIHQTNGDIEGHFSAFGLIGMLLYYRDWRTIISGTIFIYLHHLVLGYVQTLGLPIYVFDTSNFWQLFIIHVSYFLPFIAIMVYISVSLRREGFENQSVIQYANGIAKGENSVTSDTDWQNTAVHNADIIRSVTDMSKALHQAKSVLEEANETLQYEANIKDKFFSIIAHDLRSPFTSLLGMTQIMSQMESKLSKDELMEMSKSVNKSATQAFELLQNLLEWARLQMDGVRFEPKMVPLQEMAQISVDVLTSGADKKNITINNKIGNTLAFIDHDMIQMVILNLINNALKFTPQGGTIELSATMAENMVKITVADSGVGMSKKQIESVFALDQKTSTRGTDGESGTGLGLPLCKEMVETNSGTIWIESTLNEGTQFHFTVPAKSSQG